METAARQSAFPRFVCALEGDIICTEFGTKQSFKFVPEKCTGNTLSVHA
jgi:hypothetical protein